LVTKRDRRAEIGFYMRAHVYVCNCSSVFELIDETNIPRDAIFDVNDGEIVEFNLTRAKK